MVLFPLQVPQQHLINGQHLRAITLLVEHLLRLLVNLDRINLIEARAFAIRALLVITVQSVPRSPLLSVLLGECGTRFFDFLVRFLVVTPAYPF